MKLNNGKIMKMQRVVKVIFLGFFLIAGWVFLSPAYSAFDLSYTFEQGGSRLEFDRSNFSRAITFTTFNDIANNRYEIRQRIESPLRNRDNPSLTIGNNFVVRGFRGSNKYGDLRIPTGDIVVRNDELIYVSNPAGTADSFTLVYAVANTQEITPGYYTGRISLVLNPIGSAQSPITKVIEVYVSIPDDGGSLSVSVAPAEGINSLIINPLGSNGLRSMANAVVTINGSFNGPFRIMQMLPQPIQSQDGRLIDSGKILLTVPDAQKGVAVNQPTPLSNNIQTIYSSRPDGSSDKAFTIIYSLADPLKLIAGNYRSRIQYLLDSSGKQINLGALDLEIRQDRIFEISISPGDQRYNIDFADLKPSDGPRINEVLIEVKTNIGRAYQITQNILSELVSGDGNKIPSKYFSMQTLPVNDTKGSLKISNKIPVEKGDLLLFISDASGSSDRFKVIYELICPADLRAGNYSSRITYTLTEI
ncbi:MAG: hypothetical protein PHR84_04200 [Candidatus Omnitrophica bacterium]|jgi:hypothetical protein|nr:hypothetical protein [Candidatus Omnitrophota bacterium]